MEKIFFSFFIWFVITSCAVRSLSIKSTQKLNKLILWLSTRLASFTFLTFSAQKPFSVDFHWSKIQYFFFRLFRICESHTKTHKFKFNELWSHFQAQNYRQWHRGWLMALIKFIFFPNKTKKVNRLLLQIYCRTFSFVRRISCTQCVMKLIKMQIINKWCLRFKSPGSSVFEMFNVYV